MAGVRLSMNSDVEPMYVDCGVHGERVAAVVCSHLVSEKWGQVSHFPKLTLSGNWET